MTVIAWDGKTLAVDRQCTRGDIKSVRTKLTKISDSIAVATAGDSDRDLILKEWVKNGRKIEDWPAFQKTDTFSQLIVLIGNSIFEYQQEPIGVLVESPFMAWGSGEDFAMGAMEMGATAIQAVEVANRHCPTCGFGVNSISFNESSLGELK